MQYTRRDFGRLVVGTSLVTRAVPSTVFGQSSSGDLVNGVQLGAITYSYRTMPDQTAEAILRYVLESGIRAIEFMGDPVEAFAGAPPPADRQRSSREQTAAQREAAQKLTAWRTSVSMDRFKALRKRFNDAGVRIYAWKQLSPDMSDPEVEYVFNVAEALGCTHTTLELPNDASALKRIGAFAARKKMYAAYHTHLQGSIEAFDQAFAASPANMANVDFGHYVAAGGDPLAFLTRFHDRIVSFHLKDRRTPEHGAANVEWGKGDTPIRQILQLVKKNSWRMPATIEVEYDVPVGSDAVKEVAKCLEYCKDAIA